MAPATAPMAAKPRVAAPADGVELWCNGASIGVLGAEALRLPRPLVALLSSDLTQRLSPATRAALGDPAQWTFVRATSHRHALFSLATPTAKYSQHEFSVFADADGSPAFGIFRVLPPDTAPEVRAQFAAPVLAVHDLAKLEVWSEGSPEVARQASVLTLRVGDHDQALSDLAMGALAVRNLPGVTGSNRDKKSKMGWRLDEVLALAKLPGPPPKQVTVVAADAAPVKVVAAGSTLRQNRRGDYSVYYVDAQGQPKRLRHVFRLELPPPR